MPRIRSQLRNASLKRKNRHRTTVPALSSANVKYETYLKGLTPAARQPATRPKPAVIQLSAPAPPAVNPAVKPAAMQALAPASHAVKSAPYPAAMQPPAPSLFLVEDSKGDKPSSQNRSPHPNSDAYLDPRNGYRRPPLLHHDLVTDTVQVFNLMENASRV